MKPKVTRPPRDTIACKNAHIVYLCERMRQDERVQFEAFTGQPYNPEAAAVGFINTPGMKFTVVGPDNYPAACGGYFEAGTPGVWQSWMVGSEEGWKTRWRSITKASLWVMQGLMEMGARRLQTMALASRSEACRWYVEGLGLQMVGIDPDYGVNGEAAVRYVMLREK